MLEFFCPSLLHCFLQQLQRRGLPLLSHFQCGPDATRTAAFTRTGFDQISSRAAHFIVHTEQTFAETHAAGVIVVNKNRGLLRERRGGHGHGPEIAHVAHHEHRSHALQRARCGLQSIAERGLRDLQTLRSVLRKFPPLRGRVHADLRQLHRAVANVFMRTEF